MGVANLGIGDFNTEDWHDKNTAFKTAFKAYLKQFLNPVHVQFYRLDYLDNFVKLQGINVTKRV